MAISCVTLGVLAFEYIPKDVDTNPFGNKIKNNIKTEQVAQPELQKTNKQEMREIKNLTEYFKYLPNEVHRNWTPYKAKSDYEVTVQFRVHRDGSISETKIINSTNPNADNSVIFAVKSGAPYQPLPASYPNPNGVTAQVVLEYHR